MFATRRGNTITEILAISATAWGESLMTFAWPVSLSVLYPEPTGATLIAIIGVLWTLCAIWFWAQHRQTQPLLALGLCWFVLAMLPFSQLTPLQNLKADRYLLIPGVGCFIVIGWLIHKHRAMAWLTFAWVLAMMVLTQQRIEVFTSSEKLWRDATVHAPLAPRNWNSLIGVLIDEHRLTEAEIVIHKAREIHPNHPLLLQSQGLIQIAHGDTDAAIESLSVAWSQRPALQRSGNNLALMLLRKGELDKAREVAQALTKRHPRYLKGWNTLCSIEIAAKNSTKAIAASEKALSISPKSATAWVNLGTGYYLQNDRPQAATAWKNALKIDPSLEYAQRGLRALENTENE